MSAAKQQPKKKCTCPKDTVTLGCWTARYVDLECPVHGEKFSKAKGEK